MHNLPTSEPSVVDFPTPCTLKLFSTCCYDLIFCLCFCALLLDQLCISSFCSFFSIFSFITCYECVCNYLISSHFFRVSISPFSLRLPKRFSFSFFLFSFFPLAKIALLSKRFGVSTDRIRVQIAPAHFSVVSYACVHCRRDKRNFFSNKIL